MEYARGIEEEGMRMNAWGEVVGHSCNNHEMRVPPRGDNGGTDPAHHGERPERLRLDSKLDEFYTVGSS